MDLSTGERQLLDSRHVPPHNIEAERSVIGALLLDPAAFHKVVDLGIEPTDFYRDNHAKIFEAIRDLSSKSQAVDVVTLGDNLRNKGVLEQVGGLAYLTGLFEDTYSSAHVSHYAKIVKDKATLRRVISAAGELSGRAFDGVEDIEEFMDFAEKTIFDVTESGARNSFADIKTILMENMTTIQELAESKTTVSGVATGFTDLDALTTGFKPGQLIVIAARPAMGKTSFVLNIAENASMKPGSSVAVFSLEMGKEELGFRFLTSMAKVDATKMKVGKLQERDWKNLAKAAGALSERKIFIDDTAAINVLEMRSRCRRLVSEHGLSLIIVDYLQLMRGLSKGGKQQDTREREISEISRALKALAKELRVPVVALSQLNRGLEQRPDKRPMLSDLRESGAIEQDADIVMFIYRDEVYNRDSADRGVAEIIVAKHRAGPTDVVKLAWQAEFTAFANLAPNYVTNSAPPPSAYNQQEAQFDDGAPFRKGGLDLPNF